MPPLNWNSGGHTFFTYMFCKTDKILNCNRKPASKLYVNIEESVEMSGNTLKRTFLNFNYRIYSSKDGVSSLE